MNEIEKMYENAGIPKYGKRQCRDSEYLECQNYCFCNMDNKCDKFIFEYPPFTAEKQLKLVDWFIRNEADIETNFEYNDELYYLKSYDKQTIECKDFAEALANLVNIHFKDFTNIEKQQIKEILE